MSDVKLVCDMADSGLEIDGRVGESYSGKRNKLVNGIAVEAFWRLQTTSGETVSFDLKLTPTALYPEGLVCVDVDDGLLWNALVEYVSNNGTNNIIVNPTSRGGHLIFKAEKRARKRIKCLITLGFKVDILTDRVNIVSPRKSLKDTGVDLANLDTIPEFLCPYHKPRNVPILAGSLIAEGERNDTLFKWVNSTILSYDKKIELSKCLGTYFCKVPLDENECISLVKTNDSNEFSGDITSSNAKIAEILVYDTQLVFEILKDGHLFDAFTSTWYKWQETYWCEVSTQQLILEVEGYMLKNANRFHNKFTTVNTIPMASGYLSRCASLLILSDIHLGFEPGKNFLNGYFVYSERKIYPHSPHRFITDRPTINYYQDEYVNYETRRFIVNALGKCIHSIHLLRSMICRSLCEKDQLQTGYYLFGPPGSGKSTITSVISAFSPSRFVSCELKDILNPFTRHEYRDKSIIAVNEISQLPPDSENLLKSLQGRDLMATSQKNKQGVHHWRFKGVLVLMSNISPSTVLGNSNALNDRFVPIEFTPRLGDPDPNLPRQLELNGSGIINWALSMPEERFFHLTRATNINKYARLESDPLTKFILKNCLFEDHALIGLTDLLHYFQEWMIKIGEDNVVSKNEFFVELQSVSRSVFNKILEKKRIRNKSDRLTYLKGIRIKNSEEPGILLEDDSFEYDTPIWENVRFPECELSLPQPNYIDIGTNELYYNSSNTPCLDTRVPFQLPENSIELQHPVPQDVEVRLEVNPAGKPNPLEEIFAKDSPMESRESIKEGDVSVNKNLHTPKKKRQKKDKPLKSDDVLDKYGQNPIIPLGPEDSAIKFEKGLLEFKETVGERLVEANHKEAFVISHLHPFPHVDLMRERISILAVLGDVADKYISSVGYNDEIWCHSMKKAREEDPVPEADRKRHNLYQNKEYFGKLAPQAYTFDHEGSQRLKAFPAHTLRDAKKALRFQIAQKLADTAGIHLYDCDMGGCHARVVALLFNKKRAPLLHKSHEMEDLWMDIAVELTNCHPEIANIHKKTLRKAIKVMALAMLNGGGLNNSDHISDIIASKYPPNGEDYNYYMKILINILSKSPIVREYHSLSKEMHKEKRVYLVTNKLPAINSEVPHKLNSKVMCAVETCMMTYLVEYIYRQNKELLPLVIIHDGIIFASRRIISQDELREFNEGFKRMTMSLFKTEVPIEINKFL